MKPGHADGRRVYASEALMRNPQGLSLEQAMNVVLCRESWVEPGHARYSPGLRFPIGGVAAMTAMTVVSPAVSDSNQLRRAWCAPRSKRAKYGRDCGLGGADLSRCPCGVGGSGFVKIGARDLDASWWKARAGCEERFGEQRDADFSEAAARSRATRAVSERARERGCAARNLGSGNHFLEVQYVEEVHDETAARAYGIYKAVWC